MCMRVRNMNDAVDCCGICTHTNDNLLHTQRRAVTTGDEKIAYTQPLKK